jgi:hypothetical protein
MPIPPLGGVSSLAATRARRRQTGLHCAGDQSFWDDHGMARGRTSARAVSWDKAVDLEQAARNCYRDISGDWHRDPWGWPEIGWAASTRPQAAYDHLASTGARAPALLDVPKENFVLRPAVVLDPLDRLCYQALIDRESARLFGELSSAAYGWRLNRGAPENGKYVAQAQEWREYRKHVEAVGSQYPAALQTDIVSYFASIDIDEMTRRIRSALGPTSVVDRLIEMIEFWAATPGRSGLAQRAHPSSVLANMFLMPVDDVLSKLNKSGPDDPSSAIRWVDDIWVFGANDGSLRAAQVSLQRAVETLGLNLSGAKTRILEGDALAVAIRENEHSGVDQAINQELPDFVPLNELLDRILGDPEGSSRTSIRFATTRMRDSGAFDRTDELLDQAHRMPQGADHLARLGRDAGVWANRADWFIWYANSDWAVCEWPVAQLGTMFPANGLGIPNAIQELMQTWIDANSPIVLLALASHRLAHWRPPEARLAVEVAARRATASWQRRILALAGLQAGQNATWVRKMLKASPETQVTLDLVEQGNFRPLRTSTDYH